MRYANTFTFCTIFYLSLGGWDAKSGPDEVKLVADTISTYAEKMCGEFILNGENANFQITGEAKAQLNNMLQKLADIGLSGTGKFETSSYTNVVQSELGSRLNSVTECRSKISSDMSPLLIQAMSIITSSPHINSTGDNNTNIIGNNNNSESN